MKTLKYFSLFAGIGGFEYGIEKAFKDGAKCVGYSEIDKYAESIYKNHFPTHRNFGDATGIDTERLPDFDLLVGGFPCQAFSVCGHRRGFDDTRGTLFYHIARVLADKEPEYFLLENVKGLLSHKQGETFTTILGILTDLGYVCQSEILNSRFFSVPQNRERIFIFGSRNGSRPKIFPFREDGEEPNCGQQDVSSALDANYWKGSSRGYGGKHRQLIIHNVYGGFNEKTSRVFEKYSPTLRTPQGGGHIPMVAMTERRTNEAKEIRRNTKDKDFCPRRGKELVPRTDDSGNAVTATQGREQLLSDGFKVRKLLPIECERLQGFPDGWTERGAILPTERKWFPCPKTDVWCAMVVKDGKRDKIFWGNNYIKVDHNICPKDWDGEPYDICRDLCKQESHAETDALTKIMEEFEGQKPKPTTAYLVGQDRICSKCACWMGLYNINVIFGYPQQKISDTQRYKALGNAVTTTVIASLMAKFRAMHWDKGV